MSELEIFELGLALAKALGGDKEAIADIALLYRRHPEMFENFQDVVKTIEEVIKDPEIIMKNPSPNRRNDEEILVAKQINSQKMGEVGIKNDDGINTIFHANKKRVQELEKLKKKIENADGRDAHTPYTQAQSLDGRLVQKHISSAENILPQTDKSQEAQKEQRSSASQIQKPKYKEEDTNTLNSTKRRKR
ncbi:hypothetical protein [Helicobacter cappadocius]|uniref:Uncharacterized protein n=1 Tax=Helicobacter cappadocius TaxID=3063998 RepID=A0AA90PJ56_9HELI|nr:MULTISPECIES: hypothetical protein [unclassified Helicobacter]MDO7253073.1 hypothetical protein [Helicobacter sp. faydin-H75]MDP2538801.1 hypothetical protein [Helicobacter sp. faydin-H76]